MQRIRRAKLFVFLRHHRHDLFDEAFQQELATLYRGAGCVEDTYNLIGHALKKLLSVVAEQRGRDLAEVGHEAGADLVGGTSLKATLDRDWDQQGQRFFSLPLVLHTFRSGDALCVRRRCPLPERHLCAVSLESPMHDQRERTQCQHTP